MKLVNFKKVLAQLNIFAQCRRYGLSIWQCPQFLFLIMGVVIIGTAVITYAIGTRYVEDPALIALIILLLTTILFIIAFIITQGFERLAEANRMKSEFISVVSHQLRSPLSNLRWAIELLMSGRLGKIEKKQTEYFKILKENSGRMMELISDLLTVSRIEQRTLPLKKQEFSLENLIKDLILEFKPFIQSSNIEVKFKGEENLPKILADPSQIRLVAENLLDNATRYIKDKGEVGIKLEKKRGNLYFEITDSGVGIPKEDKKYIFQKFFRSENVLKYQTQGSGLGLYITKAIIEKSGGKIGFSSQEGVGSTFWFTLPIK
ncbi:MAG: HAMP domain-containing sensor histidine kinase [bacterium]|nr:HAMP domain-containing sensor histidine kinase [bacterium]